MIGSRILFPSGRPNARILFPQMKKLCPYFTPTNKKVHKRFLKTRSRIIICVWCILSYVSLDQLCGILGTVRDYFIRNVQPRKRLFFYRWQDPNRSPFGLNPFEKVLCIYVSYCRAMLYYRPSQLHALYKRSQLILDQYRISVMFSGCIWTCYVYL